MSFTSLLRNHCPNIRWLRKQMTIHKLKSYDRYVMPEEEIALGEQSFQEKKRLVDLYATRWPQYTQAVDKKIADIFLLAPLYAERTDKDFLSIDMRFCRFAYGFQPDEYEVYDLEHKDMAGRRAYISDIDRYRYVYRLNDIIDVGIYFDKYKTYQKFRPYYKREAVRIEAPGDFACFQEFILRYPSFVKKRVELSKGDSVALVDMADEKRSAREVFDALILQGRHILEARVIQGPAMNTLNSSSVNTIRVITLNTRHGIEPAFAFLKVGRNGSFVDNGGKGGLLSGIDMETGLIITDGFDEYGNRYAVHPDTQQQFCGFQLPEWPQAIALAKELSAQTPSVRYVGWDLAFTAEGWVVIEGNGGGQFIGPQIVFQRGVKSDIEAILHRVNCIC